MRTNQAPQAPHSGSVTGASARQYRDTDPEVVQALRNGDHEAYKTVFYTYHSNVRKFLLALTRSEDVAEDLSQEVLLKVWENRERLRPEEGIARFIFSLARQAIIHHYRREEVRDSYARTLSVEDIGGTQGDELLEAEELQVLIDIAVSRMPKVRQQVFRLSRYEGLSVDKIATRLDISNDSVSSHLYNALRDIREVIAVLAAFIFLN